VWAGGSPARPRWVGAPVFDKHSRGLLIKAPPPHPSGQLPAYEGIFGAANPPVHAWSTIFTYRLEQLRGQAAIDWLEPAFHKLTLNFTWWVNRKDRDGNNAFEGGFLGLDNVGVFDRSAPLPTGGDPPPDHRPRPTGAPLPN